MSSVLARARRIPLPLAACAALLLGAALLEVGAGSPPSPRSVHAIGNDDAYISYRYALNLVEGHGLVFNPGERVEGYSNLLLVLVSAALLAVLPPSSLYLGVSVLNVVCLVVALCVLHGHVKRTLGPTCAGHAALLFALCPPLWAWAGSGMETIPVLALQIALWVAAERVAAGDAVRSDLLRLAVVLNLCLLIRADGFVFVVFTAVWFLLVRRPRSAAFVGLCVAPLFALHMGFRLWYYDAWLPNTFYAKVSGPLVERIEYAAAQLLGFSLAGLLPYFVAFGFVAVAWLAHGARPRTALPFASFFSLALVAYFLYVGGDHFGERFLLALYPMGAFTVLGLFHAVERRALFYLTFVLAAWPLAVSLASPYPRYSFERYDCWITLGEFLAAQPRDRVLAVGAAGKIPYFSGLRTIDMRGLNDAHIARLEIEHFTEPGHDKYDPEYVLRRRPDLIAAWVRPNLDLSTGMRRELYAPAGYRLRWLLNAGRTRRASDVVDVAGMRVERIQGLLRAGYSFGVLERAPAAP